LLVLYVYVVSYFLSFFSSRRRHTRSKRDWSSDVCSSDLKYSSCQKENPYICKVRLISCLGSGSRGKTAVQRGSASQGRAAQRGEIGRASCRERAESSGGEAASKKRRRGGPGWSEDKQPDD